MIRVGLGFDIHPWAAGRPLIVGGVEIASERGLLGHSDADVLTHAIAEALLGALGLGDLGQHFPDSDPRYRGIRSLVLLREVLGMVQASGGRIQNVDSTLIAQAPRLSAWLEPIRKTLAEALEVDVGLVSVKAKSPEGLGVLGREEGMAAMAVVAVEMAENG